MNFEVRQCWEVPGSPMIRILFFPCKALAWRLRSCKLWGVAHPPQKKKKSESMSPTIEFLFSSMALVILGPLQIYMNFRVSLSISANKSAGILIEIVLNLYISLGSKFILTMFRLHINDCGRFSIYLALLAFISIMFCSF